MIIVLRLSHRIGRDKRITTHCGLVARAFGADSIVISGDKDKNLMDSLRKVEENWGGPFSVSYVKKWKKFITDKKNHGWKIVHLTMYGENFKEKIKILRKKDIVIVVGSEKVPPEVFELADYNIAVGNQPHSEVAALGVILYKLNGVRENFNKGKLKILPSKKVKKVIKLQKP